jgi:hypothetical protein
VKANEFSNHLFALAIGLNALAAEKYRRENPLLHTLGDALRPVPEPRAEGEALNLPSTTTGG